jgi:hypothetical protein
VFKWTSGSNNILVDPGFLNSSGGDYHLSEDSPCIDAGLDSAVANEPLDVDNLTRILGSHVDLGAYEYVLPESKDFVSDTYKIRSHYWTLFSLPVRPVDPDPLMVLNEINLPKASLQYWRNDGTGDFQSYGATFGWTGPLERGHAYWLLDTDSTTDHSLSVKGYLPTSDFELAIPSHTDAPYWIMFGTPFSVNVACDNIQFTNPSIDSGNHSWLDASQLKMVSSKALGFDPVAQNYFTAGPSSTHPDISMFQPWYGYWLLVTNSGELTIKFPNPTP